MYAIRSYYETFTFLKRAMEINATITENRIKLLAMFDTSVIASLSNVEKYQIIPLIKAVNPPIV